MKLAFSSNAFRRYTLSESMRIISQAGFQGMRLSLRGRLVSLARSIGGYTGAPSERQVRDIAQNAERLKALVEKVNRTIDQDIPRLNKLMIENNIPYIGPIERIKLD